jgi:hypothetical protein
MSTLDTPELRIMSQLTEDMTGLWELAGTGQAPPIDILMNELDRLVARRFVSVWSGTKFASEERKMPRAEARAAIRNPAFWEWSAPKRGSHIRVIATPAGMAWYFSQADAEEGVRGSA